MSKAIGCMAMAAFAIVTVPVRADEVKPCSLPGLIGWWQCTGQAGACTADQDKSEIRYADHRYWFIDGKKSRFSLTMTGSSIVIKGNGWSNTGEFTDDQCSEIRWLSDGHFDRKL